MKSGSRGEEEVDVVEIEAGIGEETAGCNDSDGWRKPSMSSEETTAFST